MEKGKGKSRLFTISCPNHHQVLANALWQSFATSYLTDFTFKGGGIKVNAHKLILEAFVPPDKLRQTAADRQFVDQEEELANMHAVLEFVYTGSVSVTKERLDHVQQIASDLDFQLLIDAVGSVSEEPISAAVVAWNGGIQPQNAESESASVVVGNGTGEPDHQSAVEAANYESQLAVGPIIDLIFQTEGDPPEQWQRRQVTESEAVAIFLEAGHQLLEEVVEDVAVVHELDPLYQVVEEAAVTVAEVVEVTKKQKKPRYARKKALDHKPPRNFVCPMCNKPFGSSFTLGRHLAIHAQTRPFNCKYCSYACNASENLHRHVAARHPEGGRQFACRTCNLRHATAFELARHSRTHTKEKPLRCTFDSACKYTFSFAKNLQRHLEVVHCVGDSQFACQHCGKRCMCQSELQRHLRRHVAIKAHRCPHCTYSTNVEASLRRHLVAKHEELEANTFKCAECKFFSDSQEDVTKHAAEVHGVDKAPITCNICGKLCGSRNLERHRLTHDPAKPKRGQRYQVPGVEAPIRLPRLRLVGRPEPAVASLAQDDRPEQAP